MLFFNISEDEWNDVSLKLEVVSISCYLRCRCYRNVNYTKKLKKNSRILMFYK